MDANHYVQEIIDKVSDGQQQFQQEMEEEEEYGEEAWNEWLILNLVSGFWLEIYNSAS